MNNYEGNPTEHLIYKFEEVVNKKTKPISAYEEKQTVEEIPPFVIALKELLDKGSSIERLLEKLDKRLDFYCKPKQENPSPISSDQSAYCRCLEQVDLLKNKLSKIETTIQSLLDNLCI